MRSGQEGHLKPMRRARASADDTHDGQTHMSTLVLRLHTHQLTFKDAPAPGQARMLLEGLDIVVKCSV